MLISHRKHFIYIRSGKVAGTSTESYFEKYCMPEGTWKFSYSRDAQVSNAGIICPRMGGSRDKIWKDPHMIAKDIKMNLNPQIWDSYFKFCNVRNPFDMLVSKLYHDHCYRPKVSIRKWLKFNILYKHRKNALIKKFRDFVKAINPYRYNSRFTINNEICVDYFIRYEDLEGGIKHVCKILDIPFEPTKIPKLKSNIRDTTIPTRDFYDDKTIAIVNKKYTLIIDTFGYSLEDL